MNTGSRSRVAIVVTFLVTWGLTTHGKYSASGDEPHYLMIAESLRSDGDLDLSNNYRQNDGRLFGHDGLVNDGHATLNRLGAEHSLHDIGLPLLVLPVYVVARGAASLIPAGALSRFRMNPGLFAYSLISLAMIALVAAAGGMVLRTLDRVWPGRRTDYLWYLIALSPPIISHAFLVFPEVPMFATTCVAVETACRPGDRRPRFVQLALVSLALGCSVWLHRKFSLYALGLFVAMCWMQREEIKRLSALQSAVLVALFTVPFALLYVWTWHYWGTWLGPQFLRGDRLRIAGAPVGALGLFADRGAGLLAYAPFYVVLPACLLMAAPELWPLLLAGLCLFVPMAAFDEWWGGFSPAARYLVPLVPIFAVCFAVGLRRRRIGLTLAILAAVQLVIDAVVWQRPRLLWPQDQSTNVLWDRFGWAGERLQRLLPDVRHGVSAEHSAAFVVLLATITVALIVRRSPAGSPDH